MTLNQKDRSRRRLLTAAIGFVIIGFFSVPILFLLYGAAGAIGGFAIIGLFSVLQLPIFLLLMRVGALPPLKAEEKAVTTHPGQRSAKHRADNKGRD